MKLRSLKRTLHSVPVKHLRRNLTLMAEQVQPVHQPRSLPYFRFASIAASVAMVAMLVIEFLPGLFSASMVAAPKSAAEAPLPMAAMSDGNPTVTEPAPLILWNDMAYAAAAEGKGGGGGGYTPTLMPGVMSVQPPLVVTPAPTEYPQTLPTPTAEPAETNRSSQPGDSPFLGIRPTEEQGQIMYSAPMEEYSLPTEGHLSLLNYLATGFAILALGTGLAAIFLRKRH